MLNGCTGIVKFFLLVQWIEPKLSCILKVLSVFLFWDEVLPSCLGWLVTCDSLAWISWAAGIDRCTSPCQMWTFLTLLNCTHIVKMSNFMLCIFYHNKKCITASSCLLWNHFKYYYLLIGNCNDLLTLLAPVQLGLELSIHSNMQSPKPYRAYSFLR